MLLTIHNNDNLPIDAHFSVELHEESITIVIESKGGGISAPGHRNYHYDIGFRLILERLGSLGAVLDAVVVDTRQTRQKNLTKEDRLLRLPTFYSYPISLAGVDDFEKLRVALCAAQKPIAQQPGAKGGNGQKRIRLFIRPKSGIFDIATLERQLAYLDANTVFTQDALAVAASEAEAGGGFDPENIEDARKRAMAAIVQREGQPRFRRELLSAYGGACAVTNCPLTDVLEAAHILPFKGALTNSVENGLLLRSDIHTLFDKGLIAINTLTWEVMIHPRLEGTEYESFRGRVLKLPEQLHLRPNVEALNKHLESSGI